MNKLFNNFYINKKVLRFAAYYNVLWGVIITLGPAFILRSFGVELYNGMVFWQILGMFTAVMGVGLYIASSDSDRYWPNVLVGLITSVMATFLFAKALITGSLPVPFSLFLLLSNAIWILPFYGILNASWENSIKEDSPPKKFHDLIKVARTSLGVSLSELSEKENVLLVFVRQFGCTFCRETVGEMAKLEKGIAGKNLTLVFVHLSDHAFADEFFSHYFNHPVHHISDPTRSLYKSLNLKRGSFFELFGPKVLLRGLYAGVFKGHGLGRIEGDWLQLGGVFVLSRGQVVFEEKAGCASHRYNLNNIPEIPPSVLQ